MPEIVLMPGMDGTGRLFARLEHALSDEFGTRRVIYPRDRTATFAEHLEIARASLPTNGPFVLVAESFSGPIAMRLATTTGPSLKGVVLVATFVTPPIGIGLQNLARWGAGLAARVPPPRAIIRRMLVGRDAPNELVEEVREALSSVSPAALAARVRILTRVDARADLDAIRVPILYIEGSRDRVVSVRERRKISSHASVTVHSFDAPHLVLQTTPAESAEVVMAFVRRTVG